MKGKGVSFLLDRCERGVGGFGKGGKFPKTKTRVQTQQNIENNV